MSDVRQALDAQKREFAKTGETYRRREDALRTKDLELQRSVAKHHRSLNENRGKCSRAERRAEDEERQRRAKEAEIERLRSVLARHQGDRGELAARVERLRRYQDFLQHVVDAATDEFAEIQDVLSRHGALQGASRDLGRTKDATERTLESTRDRLARFAKERENERLHANNEQAALRGTLASARAEAAREQLREEEGLREAAGGRRELYEVLVAIESLGRRCGARKGRKAARSDAAARLGASVSASDLKDVGASCMASLDEVASCVEDYAAIVREHPGPRDRAAGSATARAEPGGRGAEVAQQAKEAPQAGEAEEAREAEKAEKRARWRTDDPPRAGAVEISIPERRR